MKIKRLGIVGDVHAANDHLELTLQFLNGAGVDKTVCVGDVTDGPGDAERCCELLQKFEVATVRGNHDRWFLAGEMRELPDITSPEQVGPVARQFLQALPSTLKFETIAGTLLLCHGMGANDMRGVNPHDEGYALQSNFELQFILRSHEICYVVCGHTHHRMVRRFEHMTVINPGLLRDPYDLGIESGMAIADFEAGNVQFYDFEGATLVSAGSPLPLGSR